MILWVSQDKWHKSMTFGIPLSTSGYFKDRHNEIVEIAHCTFFDKQYEKPMRAIVSQATRADGNVLRAKHKIGQIVDTTIRTNIENKLWEWLFS